MIFLNPFYIILLGQRAFLNLMYLLLLPEFVYFSRATRKNVVQQQWWHFLPTSPPIFMGPGYKATRAMKSTASETREHTKTRRKQLCLN